MRQKNWVLAVLFGAIVGITGCTYDRTAWPGHPSQPEAGPPRSGNPHFTEREQAIIRAYFGQRARSGFCPPGLAKKNNGCMPPGQAKKWNRGRPLPRDVVFYDLPGDLSRQLGPPPEGYRFVRVAEDILLIAVGTAIVLDAVEDIGRTMER